VKKKLKKTGWLIGMFIPWPTRMLIQEYVLLGNFTVLPNSITTLTISLFVWLSYYWIPHKTVITEINKR